MQRLLVCVALCAASLSAAERGGQLARGPAPGAPGSPGAPGPALRRPTRSVDALLQIITEYTQRAQSGAAVSPFALSVGRGGRGGGAGGAGGAGVSVPLLILPIPVPARGAECSANPALAAGSDEDYYEPEVTAPPPRSRRPPTAAPPRRVSLRARRPPRPAAPRRPAPATPAVDDYDEPPRRPARPPRPTAPSAPAPLEPAPPTIEATRPSAGSRELAWQYSQQRPTAPHLPPALLPDSELSGAPAAEQAPPAAPAPPAPPARGGARRGYLPPTAAAPRTAPPPLRFTRSLRLRAELTVPRADYTEPYTVWWDAASGAARVDFHGGATSSFRNPLPSSGAVQYMVSSVDASGARPVRRCYSALQSAPPDAGAMPALPDLTPFMFTGYVAWEGRSAEQWSYTLAGGAGEAGAAPGEALTFRHALLVARDADQPVPLQYSVRVDSSLAGADADQYSHRYLEVTPQEHELQLFQLDIDKACESMETVAAPSAADAARLQPLRQFTRLERDPLARAVAERFEREYSRQYADATERAVRGSLLLQSERFVSSCGRQGAPFAVELNFLADRLDAELDQLRGVSFDVSVARGAAPDDAEPFPHARAELRSLAGRLPREFDWRPRGAVSPVRYQGQSCMSCWALAVTGAVEGALFVRTRRLVPLAEQCLVDCAHEYGANGCNGTWPSLAYDYVAARGLPARAAYPAYAERVLPCAAAAARPVTHISAHVNVTANDIPALKVAIRRHAPTVVIVDSRAKSFIFYKQGVLYDDRCGKARPRLNHAVLAVGWGEAGGAPHFVLKNSWSAAWGEAGYVRVQAPANTCGHLALPSYPRLTDQDVDEPAASDRDAGDAGDAADGGDEYDDSL